MAGLRIEETRKALWGAKAAYLSRAQELETEVERLEEIISANEAQAGECRRVAEEFGRAAELLANEGDTQ